ncbi:MAG TPA: hypothetical protein VGN83_03160 [Falsiroseomonas sp.]|nr:hypothetical protein [Falsiroseomonas sp.]
MASEKLVTVTLAQAWDPAGPAEQAGRIEFAVVLDQHGHPDLDAWFDDPDPWPARRLPAAPPPQRGEAARAPIPGDTAPAPIPGDTAPAPVPGDVAHDEEGWHLRLPAEGGKDPDAPGHRLLNISGGLRPGEVLTLRAPDGVETAWRVVGVSAPGGYGRTG